MKTKKQNTLSDVRRITADAMMIAMYFILDGISLKLNDFMKISFISIAVIICAMLYGMADACIVAGIGEFLIQLKFISPFLPLFVLVQVVRALIMGAFTEFFFKRSTAIENRPVWLYVMCITSGLITSVLNSGVLYMYTAYINNGEYIAPAVYWMSRIPSFTSTFVTGIVLATISIPLVKALRHAGIGKRISQ